MISGLATGGAEMMLYKLLSGSASLGVESAVIALAGGGPMRAEIESLGVPVHSLDLARASVPSPASVARLRRAVRGFAPDVVQGWMYHGNLAALAAAGGARRTPVLWNIRSSLYDIDAEKRLTALVIRLGARLSRLPAGVVYVSRVSAAQHQAVGYDASRAVIVPNGFDTARYAPDPAARAALRASLGLPADAIVIGHVARYHEIKDHANLLRAAARLHARRPDVRFVLVGAGVDAANEALGSQAASLGVAGVLHLLGERRDVARLTPGFDVATSASWGEAFPNVLGEAMACAVPCVATDVGDSAEIVGATGVVVAPRDPEALAAGWEKVLARGPDGRRALGAAARERVVSRYSLGGVIARYVELYRATRDARRGTTAERDLAPGAAGARR